MRTQLPFALLGIILACSLFTAPAHAQRARVFVASYGTDTGNTTCSFAQPCRTFQNAVNNVLVGGEVTAIDSAGFGPLLIQQAVTITSPPGVEAGIVPALGGDAITISTAGAVFLRGLTIDGNTFGSNGITVIDAPSLTIVDCVIRNFTNDGIHLVSSYQSIVLILNTIASNNGNDGIAVIGGNVVRAVFNNVQSINNGGVGFEMRGSSLGLTATIANSVASNNINNGITVGGAAYVFVRNSVVSLNLSNGVSSEPRPLSARMH